METVPTSAEDADAQLMLRTGQGDMEALSELVERHRGSIVRYLYRRVRDHAASEELAQEVFLRVHRSRESYRVTAKFTTWLYRIASHLALNWLRDNARDRLHERLDAPPAPRRGLQFLDPTLRIDEWLVRQYTLSAVRRAVNELPERQRIVVVLHKFDGVRCDRIAAELGCSHQAVRSHLSRAYGRLRVRLAGAL